MGVAIKPKPQPQTPPPQPTDSIQVKKQDTKKDELLNQKVDLLQNGNVQAKESKLNIKG